MKNTICGDQTSYGVSCGVRALLGLAESTILPYLPGGYKAFVLPSGISITSPLRDHSILVHGYTYIFSDIALGGGCKIAAEIKQYDLGELLEMGAMRNPSSGNQIKTWVWCFNGKTYSQVTGKSGAQGKADEEAALLQKAKDEQARLDAPRARAAADLLARRAA